MLLLSFIGQTRIQRMDSEGLEELENANDLNISNSTIICANVAGDFIVQITSAGVRMVRCLDLALVASWNSGFQITQASVNPTQILVALAGGRLVLLEISGAEIVETK
jgi:DNA damage-binding protein 1